MGQFWLDSVGLIPCYPLVGGMSALLWSPGVTRRTGPRPAAYVNILLSFVALIHSFAVWILVWHQPAVTMQLSWLQVADLDLSVPLEISEISVGACVLVLILNLLTQVYAVGYMENDWGWARFFALLGIFEGGMCGLALCNSLFFSYVALEILTLATYLLVGFWFNQSLVVTGARDAFLTKRVGDLLLLIGVITVYPLVGSWNFNDITSWVNSFTGDPALVTWVGLALIAGPMGKCAQFPLHLWLDEAMEGPVPSTILRNAVVVSTGAWVLIKLEPLLDLSPVVRTVAITIGVISTLGGTAIALAQTDVKRALSYAVNAYQGLIFIAVGVGLPDTALLLLLTYAIAMALMLMATGTVVWNSVTQDITLLGGLWSRRPISGLAFLAGGLTLVALPPFGCFWPLAELADTLVSTQPLLLGVVSLVSAGTALNVMRVFGLIWSGSVKPMSERSPEVLWPMVVPMMLLAGFAVHLPLVLQTWQLLPDPDSLLGSLHQAVVSSSSLILVGSTVAGLALGSYLYIAPTPRLTDLLSSYPSIRQVQDVLANAFYTTRLYRGTVVLLVSLAATVVAWIDRYFIDGAVNTVGLISTAGGEALKYTVSGRTQAYMLTILVGALAMGAIVVWSALH